MTAPPRAPRFPAPRRPLLALAALPLLAGCGAIAAPAEPLREGTEIAKVAKGCSRPRYCGRLGHVDCGAAVDGPAYYFERRTGRILGYCGGYCMGGPCDNCPPPQWTCGKRSL
ncbi:MAG TPA: hypothetical protein VF605_14235 [Allosphingosinicella sp.]